MYQHNDQFRDEVTTKQTIADDDHDALNIDLSDDEPDNDRQKSGIENSGSDEDEEEPPEKGIIMNHFTGQLQISNT